MTDNCWIKKVIVRHVTSEVSHNGRGICGVVSYADALRARYAIFQSRLQCHRVLKRATSRFAHLEKLFNPCSFMAQNYLFDIDFFYLTKLSFSGFLQFKVIFVRCQNDPKCRCVSLWITQHANLEVRIFVFSTLKLCCVLAVSLCQNYTH